jgi:hypothetical protein
MKVLIATPCAGGMVHGKYCFAMLTEAFIAPGRLAELDKYQLIPYFQFGSSGLSKDRSIAASLALRSGFDKILFIDSDQSWTWDQMKKILDSPHPITAAMIPLKSYPIQLNFTTQPQDKRFFEAEDGIVSPRGIDRWRDYNPREDYIQVSAAGTGFMSIDCKVLDKLTTHQNCEPFMYAKSGNGILGASDKELVKCWNFFPSGPINNNYYGEDYGFCIMAGQLGYPIHVDVTVEVAHHGQHEFRVAQGRE